MNISRIAQIDETPSPQGTDLSWQTSISLICEYMICHDLSHACGGGIKCMTRLLRTHQHIHAVRRVGSVWYSSSCTIIFTGK